MRNAVSVSLQDTETPSHWSMNSDLPMLAPAYHLSSRAWAHAPAVEATLAIAKKASNPFLPFFLMSFLHVLVQQAQTYSARAVAAMTPAKWQWGVSRAARA